MTVFTCEASHLLRALRAVNEIAVSAKETIPILRNVMFTISGNDAILTRSNMDGTVTKALKVESEGDWSFTVGGDKLASIVGTFSGGAQVQIKVSDGWASIVSGRSRVRLGVLPATDFPALPLAKGAAKFTVGEDYIKGLAMTVHAASTDTTRYYLIGVCHRWQGGKIRLTCTDGNRMVVYDTDGAEMPDVIVPTPAVAMLIKLATDADKITIEAIAGRMRWSFGDVTVTYKMVDGTFPDSDRLIREASDVVAKVDTDDAIGAIGRIMILADDKDRTARLSFDADKLTIESRGDVDQGADDLPCEVAGGPMTVAFRTQYLREALTSFDVDAVEIGMVGPRDPAMIRSEQKPHVVIVIMPTT